MYKTVGFFTGGIGPWEILILGVVALLIFGRRLPEVGRSLGKGIVEFKKGLAGIENDISDATSENKKQIDPPESETVDEVSERPKQEVSEHR